MKDYDINDVVIKVDGKIIDINDDDECVFNRPIEINDIETLNKLSEMIEGGNNG